MWYDSNAMPRYPQQPTIQLGPGPVTPAVKVLLVANVAMFVGALLVPALISPLALTPSEVVRHFAIWQLVTYLFLHAGIFHILFNMLTLWMFGVELERMWGTPFFTRYYFVTGIGAGVVTVAASLLPFAATSAMFDAMTMGASGAIYGLLLAYGLYFPNRPIYLYFLFQVPAKYFVMIIGAISLISSLNESGGNLSHVAHLGGLVVGYVYLKARGPRRFSPIAEIRYRYTKWKLGRMRRRFDVHPGGRSDDWNQRIH